MVHYRSDFPLHDVTLTDESPLKLLFQSFYNTQGERELRFITIIMDVFVNCVLVSTV